MVAYGNWNQSSGVSLSEVFNSYNPLILSDVDISRGNYRVACPLHNSSNPTTLCVTDDEVFYCFACHKGGSVIELYSTLYGVSRSEAYESLQISDRLLGMEGNDNYSYNKIAQETRRRIKSYSSNEEISGESRLQECSIARSGNSLLENNPRKISASAISHYSLSFSLRPFRGIYIPIRTLAGNTIGYTIRKSAEGGGKYYHSPGLKKKNVLYGLYENLNAVRESMAIYLVEGVFDCIALWSIGITNTSAVLGSQLSTGQIRLLLPYVNTINLVFDGDEAGREGMGKAKSKYSSIFRINTIELPDGEDPDSMDKSELMSEIGGN